MADYPEWWTKLTPEGQATYLRVHPNSKMAQQISAKLKNDVKADPKLRQKARSILKKISSDPIKQMNEELKKFDKPKKIPKSKQEAIERAVREGKRGNLKGFMKGVGIALAVAGVATMGAGIMAGGGLPYVILTARLIKDAKTVYTETREQIRTGVPATQAVLNSTKTAVVGALRDPKVILAAMMLATKRKGNDDEEEKPSSTKTSKTESKKPKTQTMSNHGKPKVKERPKRVAKKPNPKVKGGA